MISVDTGQLISNEKRDKKKNLLVISCLNCWQSTGEISDNKLKDHEKLFKICFSHTTLVLGKTGL